MFAESDTTLADLIAAPIPEPHTAEPDPVEQVEQVFHQGLLTEREQQAIRSHYLGDQSISEPPASVLHGAIFKLQRSYRHDEAAEQRLRTAWKQMQTEGQACNVRLLTSKAGVDGQRAIQFLQTELGGTPEQRLAQVYQHLTPEERTSLSIRRLAKLAHCSERAVRPFLAAQGQISRRGGSLGGTVESRLAHVYQHLTPEERETIPLRRLARLAHCCERVAGAFLAAHGQVRRRGGYARRSPRALGHPTETTTRNTSPFVSVSLSTSNTQVLGAAGVSVR